MPSVSMGVLRRPILVEYIPVQSGKLPKHWFVVLL